MENNDKVVYGKTKYGVKASNGVEFNIFQGKLTELMKASMFSGSKFMDGVALGQRYAFGIKEATKEYAALVLGLAALGDSKIEGNEGFNVFTQSLAKIVAPMVYVIEEAKEDPKIPEGYQVSDEQIHDMLAKTHQSMMRVVRVLGARHAHMVLTTTSKQELELSAVAMRTYGLCVQILEEYAWPVCAVKCEDVISTLKQLSESLPKQSDTTISDVVECYDETFKLCLEMAKMRGELK